MSSLPPPFNPDPWLPPMPLDFWLPPPRPAPPPPPTDQGEASAVRLVIGFILSLFSVFLCSCCKGYQNGQARVEADPADEPRPQQLETTGRNGEQQLRAGGATNTAARLPAFKYSWTVKHRVTGGGEEAPTCSVCLGAFQLGEKVRLLPVCLHLYHTECIDL
jgi:hypothetical protein